MKTIHIWISSMIILCATALLLLTVMSSCSQKKPETESESQADSVAEETPGKDSTGETDTDAPDESGTPSGGTDGETVTVTETDTERQTETESEEQTETESETDPPKKESGLRYVSNADGTCYLAGVGSCTDACIVIPESYNGEKVVGIAASAFFGCKTLSAVQIPATVLKIGDLAFADCPNLTYISVSAGNPAYRDQGGVLYSADGCTLILYPASRGGDSVTIAAQVKTISAMAFYGCRYLRTVHYGGTYAAWERVNIGSGNYSLSAAMICIGTPDDKSAGK